MPDINKITNAKQKNKTNTVLKLYKRVLSGLDSKKSKISAEDLDRLVKQNEIYLTAQNNEATEIFINKLIDDLLQYANDEKNTRNLSFFYKSRGIDKGRWHTLLQAHANLRIAADYAKSAIGERREQLIFQGEIHSLASRNLAQYIDEYRDQYEFESSLRQTEKTDQQIIVHMEKFPELKNPEPQKPTPEEVAMQNSMRRKKG